MRASIALTAAAGAWALPAPAPHAPVIAGLLDIPRTLDGSPGAVALTFDDGPHPEGTPAVLEVLERERATATFFLVGEQVERRPALAREIRDAGHGIALHGQLHRNLLRLSPGAARDDLRRGLATVATATGQLCSVYRPPYGVMSTGALAAVRRSGLRPLLWSRWGRDWRARATPLGIARKAAQRLSKGDVVLLHDADFYSAAGSWRRTAEALPHLIEAVRRRGLDAISVPGTSAAPG